MAGEFLVGAVFDLDAAPAITALESIGRAFDTIADLATSLQDRLATIGEAAFAGLSEAVSRATGMMNEQIAQVDRLTSAYDRAAIAADRAAFGGGAAGRERESRGERPLPSSEPPIIPLPGEREEPLPEGRERPVRERKSGAHGRISATESGLGGHAVMDVGLGTLAAGWGLFKSEESAMEEQKNITETLAGINVTPDDPKFKEDYDRLHQMLIDKTRGTKYSNLQASKIMLESLPTLGLSGDASVDAATNTDIFQTALNAGELSAFRGKGEPGAEAKASFQFAHLMGEFEPDKMSKLIDMVNAIAFRTGSSIATQESIMKYAAPIGLLAGLPVQDTVGIVGSAENRLGDTSTAGTGFSQFILGGMAWKGETAHGLKKHQQDAARAAEKDLEAAVRLDPSLSREHDAARTQAGLNRHDQAIVDLKIRDRAGHLLPGAMDATGDYSERKVEELVKEYAAHHTKEEVTRVMSAGFETRGARFAQPFTTAEGIEREHQQMESYKNAPTVKKELETLQNLPIQQFEQMLSNLANTGNILATETLGPLNTLFKTTNSLLIGFNDFLTHHQGVATAIGDTALGGAALGIAALGVGVGRYIWKNTGAPLVRGGKWLMSRGGVPTAAESAEGGANLLGESLLGEGGAAAGGGLALPLLGAGALLGGAYLAGSVGSPMFDEFGRQISGPPAFPTSPPQATLPGPRAGTAATSGPSGSSGPASITITIHNIMNGVADPATYQGLLDKFTASIKSAIGNATSDSHGTGMSQYVSGGL